MLPVSQSRFCRPPRCQMAGAVKKPSWQHVDRLCWHSDRTVVRGQRLQPNTHKVKFSSWQLFFCFVCSVLAADVDGKRHSGGEARHTTPEPTATVAHFRSFSCHCCNFIRSERVTLWSLTSYTKPPSTARLSALAPTSVASILLFLHSVKGARLRWGKKITCTGCH